MSAIIAVATDDCLTVKDGHFGDSDYYAVYEIENNKVVYKRRLIGDELRQEYDHSDHEGKAGVIIQGLQAHNVEFVISGKFGINIVHVLKELIPVKSEIVSIHETMDVVLNNIALMYKTDKDLKKFIVKLKEDSVEKIYI
jgi:predicted Fe-Mo cluster-binding NifX family protein